MISIVKQLRLHSGTIDLQIKPSGKRMILAIFKNFVALPTLLYCTLFLAVATPFIPSHSLLIYIPGFALFILFASKFVLCIFSAVLSRKMTLIVSGGDFSISNGSDGVLKCKNEEINSFTLILGSFLLIRKGETRVIFPLLFAGSDSAKKFDEGFDVVETKFSHPFSMFRFVFEVVAVSLVISVHVIYYIAGNYYIPTGSMKDTLMQGDWILAEKISYGVTVPKMLGMRRELHPSWLRFSSPKRGDIVIFTSENSGERKEYVKRCVALAGDDVKIADGAVFINGRMLEEDYACGMTTYRFFENGKIDGIVPPGKIVVLGDNREDSRDSREFGYVPVANVEARVVLLYSNVESIKHFDFARFGSVK